MPDKIVKKHFEQKSGLFRFPDLLKLFGLLRRDISDPLRKVDATFELGAENIVLKPQEWTLVAIILLKMYGIPLSANQCRFQR